MDRLSVLLTRFGFSTETFFHGQFCGSKHFPARPRTGHLHLVRQGAVGFRHDDGTLLQVDEPSLVLYPGPYAHGLEVGPEPAQLLCATIHLRGDDASIRIALPPCIRIRLRQLPSLAGTLDMLFDEAEHGASMSSVPARDGSWRSRMRIHGGSAIRMLASSPRRWMVAHSSCAGSGPTSRPCA